MGTANATAASARTATTAPSVTSAPAARRPARDTGEASAPVSWEQGHSETSRAASSLLVVLVIKAQLATYWYSLDRDCAECGAFGTGSLAANCSLACTYANVTLVSGPILDDWCKARTLDNQLFFFLVEDKVGGRVVLRVRPQESK